MCIYSVHKFVGCVVPNFEEARNNILISCNCETDSDDCQLNSDVHSGGSCKKSADVSCKNAITAFAALFQNAANANDPECKDNDQRYQKAFTLWKSCESGYFSNLIVSNITNLVNIWIA